MKKLFTVFTALTIVMTLIASPALADEHHERTGHPDPMVQTAENSQVKLKVTLDPGESEVGHLTKINGQIINQADNRPVTNVLVKITAHHIEDDKTMLYTEFIAADGEFSFENQFFDGAEHLLTFSAEPTASSSSNFTPISKQFPVEVAGVQPPLDVKVKTMVFLLGLMAIGMLVGVTGAKARKSRRAVKPVAPANDLS